MQVPSLSRGCEIAQFLFATWKSKTEIIFNADLTKALEDTRVCYHRSFRVSFQNYTPH